LDKEISPPAEIKRPPSFRQTAHFFDGHRRPRLYRTGILSQKISLLKYPSCLTFIKTDPQIVQTSPER
jgi:hypothetical protein